MAIMKVPLSKKTDVHWMGRFLNILPEGTKLISVDFTEDEAMIFEFESENIKKEDGPVSGRLYEENGKMIYNDTMGNHFEE